MPVRIQLSRRKGWRLPESAVNVARPTRFGNPFTIAKAVESGYAKPAIAQAFVVQCFRDWCSPSPACRERWWMGPESDQRRAAILDGLPALRGRDLACWCELGAPCHADVLLDLANAPASEEAPS